MDASEMSTGGGNVSRGGGGGYVSGYALAYLQLPIGGSDRAHNNIQHNRDSDLYMDNK